MNYRHRLAQATYWQLRLLYKYNIILIAFVVALIYGTLLTAFPILQIDYVIIPLILGDPTMLGFIFIGVIVLFEKAENTLPALQVTPMQTNNYLWSKALALLVPAIICSVSIAIAAYGIRMNYFLLIITVTLSSLIFTFIGIVGVSRVKTFNQYILIIPLFLTPTVLPFFNFYGATNWLIWYLVPTHSTLDLLLMAVYDFNIGIAILHVLYLLAWVFLSYHLAKKAYENKLTS